MIVSVTVKFTIPTVEKHRRQMRQAAQSLTNARNSIEILQPASDSKILTVRFTVPTARQDETVDHIARRFWDFIEDYSDSSIGFSSESRQKFRSGK
jgi:hypothetical protein